MSRGWSWTPGNIFEARGKVVRDGRGRPIHVYLNEHGWGFAAPPPLPFEVYAEGLDVWSACRFLNDRECYLPKAE